MSYYKKSLLIFLILVEYVSQTASASLDDWVSGDIRSYYFIRDYTNPAMIDQTAYSLGGDLKILTPDILDGFQLGAALYTAQDLGLDSDNPKEVDKTLASESITTLAEAFLQYQNSKLLFKIMSLSSSGYRYNLDSIRIKENALHGL